MYTIKLLAPAALMLCAESALTNRGHCALDAPKPYVVRYYEPGKSCYVNGIFYEKCEDRLNGTK
jgi:hypothetical protein